MSIITNIITAQKYDIKAFWLSSQTAEDYEKFQSNHQVGNIVQYQAYISTSKDRNGYPVEGEKAVSLKIKTNHGKDILSLGFGIPEEIEIIIPRNAEVVKFNANDNKTKLLLNWRELCNDAKSVKK